ncbi:hypothetical protein AAG565_15710 [Fontimonas sp. SYSU GA230001]|uniref:hypothetical protein n=1 Tax=Fontimonas sp. SYSU GA230001 TaxID=3142450 RepID=UPI0032B5B721
MKKRAITTSKAVDDLDEVPPLPADFGRRALFRRNFVAIDAGPDAPAEFKELVKKHRPLAEKLGYVRKGKVPKGGVKIVNPHAYTRGKKTGKARA